MGNLEQNRRRNQVIADRAGLKAEREAKMSDFSDRRLWDLVEDCIASSIHTQRYMGHPDKTVQAVLAQAAVVELKLRGVQLRLEV